MLLRKLLLKCPSLQLYQNRHSVTLLIIFLGVRKNIPGKKTLEKLPPSHRKIDVGNLVPRKMAPKNCFTGFSLLLTYLAVVNFLGFYSN